MNQNQQSKDFAVREVSIGSSRMETPDLPRCAVRLDGTAEPQIKLSGSTGGCWQFLFQVPDYRTSGMPAPDAENQDFDFSRWEHLPWEPVKVPGELVMQGFDIANNVEYYYRRRLDIPADYAGKEIFLRLEGVYSNARVWINGKYVRTHVGGFTAWDCNLTGLVQPGESAELVIGAADVFSMGEERCPGIWNPDSAEVSNPAAASWYAHHNIGGILRDVSLFALPKTHLVRTYIETTLDQNFVHAELKVTLQLAQEPETAAEAELSVRDGEKTVVSAAVSFAALAEGGRSGAREITVPVTAPKLWDAEHPNLYTLKTVLKAGGKAVQVNEERFGFREIHYGGRDGTDPAKIYVNGREVKLRGTCRHDISADLGRSITREEAFAEIRAFKKNNINHIRTSHYAVSADLLDACDEYGIYVEEEAAVCFIGQQIEPVSTRFEDYGPQFAEMIERDRNRPSILIWSIGNENHYDKMNAISGGNPILKNREYLKEVDTTRPAVWSYLDRAYEESLPENFSDIYSKHYNPVDHVEIMIDPFTGKQVYPEIPVLHDEFAHIPCYNLDELERDSNVRNFWGESIQRGWNNIFRQDGQLGCALWGGIDDVFPIPAGTQGRWRFDGRGPMVGWGEWGSVLDIYKREKPEAYLTKKAFSPVRVEEEACRLENGTLIIPVKNWFDHTDLNELTVKASVDGGELREFAIAESVAPHQSGEISLPLSAEETAKTVRLQFFTPDSLMADEYLIPLKKIRYAFAPPAETAPAIFADAEVLTVCGEDFTVKFDRKTGLLAEASRKGKLLLKGGPYLELTGAAVGEWMPDADPLEWKPEGREAAVTISGRYSSAGRVKFELHLSSDGILRTEYTLLDGVESKNLSVVSIRYALAEETHHIRWKRKGLYSAYPADHIGRNEGTALRVREQPGEEVYGLPPAWPWKEDMREFFLLAPDDPNNGIATRDFRAMREHVIEFNVYGGEEETAPYVAVESPEAEGAAQVRARFASHEWVDDADSRLCYTGAWKASAVDGSYNGTEHCSTAAGDACELTFQGTGITFFSAKQRDTGKLKIYLDGVFQEEADTFSAIGSALKQNPVYSTSGLPEGTHTIRIEISGEDCRGGIVDAFQIHRAEKGGVPDFSLILTQQWSYPGLQWGNYSGRTVSAAAGTSGSAVIRLTDHSTLTER